MDLIFTGKPSIRGDYEIPAQYGYEENILWIDADVFYFYCICAFTRNRDGDVEQTTS